MPNKKRRISELKPIHKAFLISTVQTIEYHNRHRKAQDRRLHYSYKLRATIARDMARLGLRGRGGRPYSVQRISQIAAELDHEWKIIWRHKKWDTNAAGHVQGQATRIGFYRKFGRPGFEYIKKLCLAWSNEFAGLGLWFKQAAGQFNRGNNDQDESQEQRTKVGDNPIIGAAKDMAGGLFNSIPDLGPASDPAPG